MTFIKYPAEFFKKNTETSGKNIKNENNNSFLTLHKHFVTALFYTVLVASSVFLGILFFIFYKRNFSPSAILNRSVAAFFNKKRFIYQGEINITFSYEDNRSDLNIDDVEIYSLLRRSASDSHSINFSGVHRNDNQASEGEYDFIWSISDKKAFTVDGYYRGKDFFYKLQTHLDFDVIDEDSKTKFSKVDIGEIASKVVNQEKINYFSNINKDKFRYEISEIFRNDMINGKNSYHYKVKLDGVDYSDVILDQLNLKDVDVWINEKENEINRMKGCIALEDVGTEGNKSNICFDIFFLPE